jgi:hypothetical protein
MLLNAGCCAVILLHTSTHRRTTCFYARESAYLNCISARSLPLLPPTPKVRLLMLRTTFVRVFVLALVIATAAGPLSSHRASSSTMAAILPSATVQSAKYRPQQQEYGHQTPRHDLSAHYTVRQCGQQDQYCANQKWPIFLKCCGADLEHNAPFVEEWCCPLGD